MRISDWSSDVCSSDLPVANQVGSFLLLHGAQRAGFQRFAWPPDGEQRQRDRGRKRIGHGRADQHLHHDRRTEEHTSELQSLMRISYAVFCLKIKNTKLIMILHINFIHTTNNLLTQITTYTLT